MKKLATTLLLLALMSCSAAAATVYAVGPVACGILAAVLGPRGEYWGTACSGLAQAIAAEIAADAPSTKRAALKPCSHTVPVPGFEGSAWVCPGLEEAAARGAQKYAASTLDGGVK